jgi:UDP-N-acetylmuramoyl-L-alanyl-D-glutamate--2,6-diaminopimelate ligase
VSRAGGDRGPPTLDAVIAALPSARAARLVGDGGGRVLGMTHDSRRVTPGVLFACIRGEHHDGHRYAGPAVAAGAVGLLVDHDLGDRATVPQIVVDDTRLAVGPAAAASYQDPSAELLTVGITGTNGKTTTSQLLAAILRASGRATGVIGTLSGSHTTPEAPDLQERLAEFRDNSDRAVVMEVSSHALALHRVDGTHFAAAVFTNLGRDHLDLHHTTEEYFRAKAALFAPDLSAVGVANVDDAHGRLLLDASPIEMVGFSATDASDVEIGVGAHAFTWRGERLHVALGGAFNVMNTLAAATTAAVLGIDPATIAAGLADVAPVPGRFERVDTPAGAARRRGFDVIVDYAHTPDGLEQLIAAARRVDPDGRILLVFGCGGDRDHAKRPQMGAVAVRLADWVAVTSDNPRSEPPLAIIDDVLHGMLPAERAHVTVETDRRAAIALALAEARPGDLVLVAGKGHETTQTIGDDVVDFDDRAVVRELLGGAS